MFQLVHETRVAQRTYTCFTMKYANVSLGSVVAISHIFPKPKLLCRLMNRLKSWSFLILCSRSDNSYSLIDILTSLFHWGYVGNSPDCMYVWRCVANIYLFNKLNISGIKPSLVVVEVSKKSMSTMSTRHPYFYLHEFLSSTNANQ